MTTLDTKKLVVRQDVYVVSSNDLLFCQGKVVKITPEGVEVQDDYGGLLHFDCKGKGLDRLRDGTYENGAYYINDFG